MVVFNGIIPDFMVVFNGIIPDFFYKYQKRCIFATDF